MVEETKEAGKGNEIPDAELGRLIKVVGRWLGRLLTAKHAPYAITVLVVGAGGLFGGHAWGSASSASDQSSVKTSTSGPPVRVSINPSTTGSVSRCDQVQGTATVASGEGVLIVVEGLQPPVYYLEGMAKPRTDQTGGSFSWYFPTSIGGATSPATTYSIYALVLSPQMTQFVQTLENATTLDGDLWTQATTSLPAYLAVDQQTVQRDDGTNETTCS